MYRKTGAWVAVENGSVSWCSFCLSVPRDRLKRAELSAHSEISSSLRLITCWVPRGFEGVPIAEEREKRECVSSAEQGGVARGQSLVQPALTSSPELYLHSLCNPSALQRLDALFTPFYSKCEYDWARGMSGRSVEGGKAQSTYCIEKVPLVYTIEKNPRSASRHPSPAPLTRSSLEKSRDI